MKCESCGGTKFESTTQTVVKDASNIVSAELGKGKVQVKMVFTCTRCQQQYAGQWTGRVLVPLEKIAQAPFPPWAVSQCRDEFGAGWDNRHAGPSSSASAPGDPWRAGWLAADEWASNKRGRPPMKGGWKEVVGTYLQTEPAWEYMRTLVTQRAFSS